MTSLLPLNSTPAERAIEAATDRPIAAPIRDLWNPERCPVALLPWLAWALSVDDWDASWTEEVQRAVIAASIEIHRHKGTIWAMKRAVQAAGLGGATITEGYSANTFDGSFTRDGSRIRENSDHWAEYRVILDRALSIAQAARARIILTAAAPVRCHIKYFSFVQAANLYDGTVPRDGQYTRGIV